MFENKNPIVFLLSFACCTWFCELAEAVSRTRGLFF